MIQTAIDYASELHKTGMSHEELSTIKDIFDVVPQVKEELNDPTVSLEKKHLVIQKVFSKNVRNFLQLLCDNDDINLFDEVCKALKELEMTPEQKESTAVLTYVEAPSDEQLAGIKGFIAKEFHNPDIKLEMVQDSSIKSGFVLKVGSKEYDWSEKARIDQLKSSIAKAVGTGSATASEKGILSILEANIEDFQLEVKDKEIGVVNWVGDGIANVDGIDHAFYGEIVIFDSGVKGMVQDVRRDEVGVILFGSDIEVKEGSKVVRTGKMAGVPVGEGFLGRIVDALGSPIDDKGDIQADGYRPVECEAPGITERKSVSVPMETGLLSIDSMFPIGRGQRELIIGDRQTGKTAIAIDTIINQKGQGVHCIYVAIGQKASTVASIVKTLEEYGAMSYTTVVASTASELAPLQYIAPYSGCAIGEEWMENGEDVLVIYDDLSKHAMAYRTLSLLLKRAPGREAYPGDVFYLHSRLLERAARLSDKLGGGSLTALPIIETQAGDVSAYIPTNVISITDGQIYLETEMFNAGFRPAINAGLSVSRVGGAAQIKAMKKIAAPIRTELAQYRELAAFAQFGSELDADTSEKLAQGERLKEILKQPQYQPMPVAKQIVIIYAAVKKYLMDIPVEEILHFQDALLELIDTRYPEITGKITETQVIDEETEQKLIAAIQETKKEYLA